MTALVTGATGFIGSHLVEELLRQDTPVRALVRGPGQALGLQKRGVEVLVGDVGDAAVWPKAMRGVDTVYHCATVRAAGGPGWEACAANRDALHHLLEAVRQAGRGRVVLLSSLNVLGFRHLDPATEGLPRRRTKVPEIDEKAEAEELALTYHRLGVEVVILRPAFVYGPRDGRNLPKLVRSLRRGKFRFVGSRHHVVPLVHVADLVQAMLAAARTPAADGRVYHVADGSRTTIGDLVSYLAGLAGVEPPRRVVPYAVPYAACLVFDRLVAWGRLRKAPLTWTGLLFVGTSRFVDVRRAREELGYTPRVSSREGLAATLESWEEHRHEHAAVGCPAV